MAGTEEEHKHEEEEEEIDPSDDNDEKLSRKYSCTSVASTDVNEDEGGEEEDEEKKSIALGPPVALKDQLELDKVRINRREIFFLHVYNRHTSLYKSNACTYSSSQRLEYNLRRSIGVITV